MNSPTASKKQPPRYGRIDGKRPSRPRGRHAVPHPGDDTGREVVVIPVTRRLGFRVDEFAALIGVSRVTIWRGIAAGKIDVVEHGGMKIIPRSYAVKAGYITADDAV